MEKRLIRTSQEWGTRNGLITEIKVVSMIIEREPNYRLKAGKRS